MGSSSSSSSTAKNSDCYLQNKLERQQCLQTHSNNDIITSKTLFENNPLKRNCSFPCNENRRTTMMHNMKPNN
ncbi:hypothetical protein I4U23_014839 [Adineta vaga]|nr:hypothetical protein I4U23_014839 [Adineta vaga]